MLMTTSQHYLDQFPDPSDTQVMRLEACGSHNTTELTGLIVAEEDMDAFEEALFDWEEVQRALSQPE